MRSRQLGITLPLVCISVIFSVVSGAQQPANPSSGRTSAATYGGGGVRGATADAPDGFLVTPEEMLTFNQNDGTDKASPKRSRSIEPELDILAPQPGQALTSPVTIQFAFRPLANAPLDMASVQVLYGASRVDVTPRTQALTQTTPEGFSLSGVRLPPGKHSLFIEAQDAKGRRVHATLALEVN